ANFVDHHDPRGAQQSTRTALAALDPAEFPVLTGQLDTIVAAVTDHGVYHDGLRRIIASWVSPA
ncbi:hypothetical protein AB0B25_27125, partial [Nocardia sp. NPDC049190]|uniref:hypothetical protein n=1 Tax=Nocardia sp. NPDC049190 TaxID=3155650 RepID=UPI0033EABC61